jgi:hypothetical protein
MRRLVAPVRRSILAATLSILAAALTLSACSDSSSGPGVLAPPAGLTGAVQPNGEVQLNWTAVSGATSYRLERTDPTQPGVFTEIGGAIATNTYVDGTVLDGTTYGYRVASANSVGVGDFSAVVNVATTGLKVATITGFITGNRTLYADTTYTLVGFVKVINGSTLTIQAGTVVYGDAAVVGSSLWINRGSKIDIQGTAAAPVVFTSSKAPGSRAPGDWGGIVMIGNGIINRAGTVFTEGPVGVQENYGGGTNNADNSGNLRYFRIEFAGFDVSGGGNSELNGLSMYAIGSGTVLEYGQTNAGLDDSFEWWGGAVDGRYLVSYNSGDDHFDATEGWVGRLQYIIGFQNARLVPAAGTGVLAADPQGFEIDGCAGSGCTLGTRSTPFTDPIVANFTMVGYGDLETQTAGGRGGVWRRGTIGAWSNGIIARWPSSAISVRDTSVTLAIRDSLTIQNVVLAQDSTRPGSTLYEASSNPVYSAAQFTTLFSTSNHRLSPLATDVITSITPPALDWRPKGIALVGGNTVPLPTRAAGNTANFFGGTLTLPVYVGAVDPASATPWYTGWTTYFTN